MAWITSDGKWLPCFFDMMSIEEYANFRFGPEFFDTSKEIPKLEAECDEIIASGHYDGEKLKDIIDFENEFTQSLLTTIQQEVNE